MVRPAPALAIAMCVNGCEEHGETVSSHLAGRIGETAGPLTGQPLVTPPGDPDGPIPPVVDYAFHRT